MCSLFFFFKLWVTVPDHPHTSINLIRSEVFWPSKSFGGIKGLDLVTVESSKPKIGPTKLLLIRLSGICFILLNVK